MYHAKKFPEETMMLHKSQGGGGGEQFANGGGLNGSAVKNVQPAGGGGKQRLRWTSDLHDRFVDAITQLGGPDSEDSQEKQEFESRYVTKREECYHLVLGSTDRLGPVPQTVKKQFRVQELTRGFHTRPISVASSLSSYVPIPEFLGRRTVAVSGATPKGVLRVMGVPGLTIYHVKSHLQKYRLAKYLPESPGDGKDSKDEKRNSGDSISGADSSPGLQINDALRMQMEVQKRLHEQLEVQKQLQMRIEAQGKYLQKIIEEQQKLGSTLAASETLPLSHDKQNQPLSEPSGSSDALAGTFSPHKKQRIDEGSKDGFTASQVTRKTAQKNDCDVGPLDPNLYEDDAGYGFDLETENDDGNESEQ